MLNRYPNICIPRIFRIRMTQCDTREFVLFNLSGSFSKRVPEKSLSLKSWVFYHCSAMDYRIKTLIISCFRGLTYPQNLKLVIFGYLQLQKLPKISDILTIWVQLKNKYPKTKNQLIFGYLSFAIIINMQLYRHVYG